MPLDPHPANSVSGAIVDASLRIHRDLGPGLLESVYELTLTRALEKRGFIVERQKSVAIDYDGDRYPDAFRADLVVDDCVIVELKSVETILAVHSKTLLTYLRLLNMPIGLLINFAAPTLKEGIHRIVNEVRARPT